MYGLDIKISLAARKLEELADKVLSLEELKKENKLDSEGEKMLISLKEEKEAVSKEFDYYYKLMAEEADFIAAAADCFE